MAPMQKNQEIRINKLRYLHEFMFSFNIVLASILAQSNSSGFPLETKLKYRINDYLHLHPHNNLGGDIAPIAVILAFTFLIFSLMRILSGTALASELLRPVAGATAVLAFPGCWLYEMHSYESPGAPNPPQILLTLELLAAGVYAMFHLYKKRRISPWVGVTLLVLHYGLWSWLFLGGLYFWRAPFLSILPLAGLCSSLVWGLYVSREAGGRLPGEWTTLNALKC